MFPRFPESRGPELPPGGHGLQGMQTRVGMLGGDFDAGRAQVAGSAYRPACRCAIRPVSRWKARPLVRTGFRLIIAEADDIEVVGEAGDGAEAVRVTAAAHPDVVLMDIRMPVGAADILKHPAHGVRSGITLTTQ